MNKKNVIKDKANIFQRMLEDLNKLAKQRGIKFVTPL